MLAGLCPHELVIPHHLGGWDFKIRILGEDIALTALQLASSNNRVSVVSE